MIVIVLGTRPEIIKFSPIVKEIRDRNIEHKIIFTSQHFSPEMGEHFFKEFKMKPHVSYPKKFEKGKVLNWLEVQIAKYEPESVLVQGDTLSAFLGALAAAHNKVPIAHIEAGLRSYNYEQPFPEEYYRTMIDSIATYHFCPTKQNRKNIKKGIVTGNTIIDVIKDMGLKRKRTHKIIITLHRRENWNIVEEILRQIKMYAETDIYSEYIFVLHANKDLSAKVGKAVKGSKIKTIPPQPYNSFVRLLNEAKLVISDSGGVIEECSYLKVPLFIIREETERMEAVQNGNAKLINPNKDGEVYLALFNFFCENKMAKKMEKRKCPFGDGNAASKIVEYVMSK
jgi:UDP-N-acetylglucosamine 2-epimerase (non-hydrolysing)